jgi:uncharacterized protein YkwD
VSPYSRLALLLVAVPLAGSLSCTTPLNLDVGDIEGIGLGSEGASATRILQLEEHMHALVRESRSEAGVEDLAIRYDVSAVARGHSESMLDDGFFDHVDGRGRDEAGRLDRAGVPYDRVDEVIGFVIARDGVTMDDLDAIHAELMAEDGPRSIILDPDWTGMGYGVAVAADDDAIYVTGVFLEYPPRVIGVKSGAAGESNREPTP